jgi:hypothetical protein
LFWQFFKAEGSNGIAGKAAAPYRHPVLPDSPKKAPPRWGDGGGNRLLAQSESTFSAGD